MNKKQKKQLDKITKNALKTASEQNKRKKILEQFEKEKKMYMRKEPIILDKSELMNILVVEDNAYRIDLFRRKLDAFCNLTICTDAPPAIEQVRKNKFDLIMLDHDLGNRVYVDSSDENTGYQVAKVIPETINADTKVIVHSLNPAGVNNICSVLPHAERFQFGSFTFEWDKNHLTIKRRMLSEHLY